MSNILELDRVLAQDIYNELRHYISSSAHRRQIRLENIFGIGLSLLDDIDFEGNKTDYISNLISKLCKHGEFEGEPALCVFLTGISKDKGPDVQENFAALNDRILAQYQGSTPDRPEVGDVELPSSQPLSIEFDGLEQMIYDLVPNSRHAKNVLEMAPFILRNERVTQEQFLGVLRGYRDKYLTEGEEMPKDIYMSDIDTRKHEANIIDFETYLYTKLPLILEESLNRLEENAPTLKQLKRKNPLVQSSKDDLQDMLSKMAILSGFLDIPAPELELYQDAYNDLRKKIELLLGLLFKLDFSLAQRNVSSDLQNSIRSEFHELNFYYERYQLWLKYLPANSLRSHLRSDPAVSVGG